jgi:prepilin signal peptidase PulO-like enzyme (type II secretory pathway)
MGWRDVKYSGVIGAVLGIKLMLAAFYAGVMTGGVAAVLILITGKRDTRPSLIPYGVFLSIGALVMLYSGTQIMGWAGDTFVR